MEGFKTVETTAFSIEIEGDHVVFYHTAKESVNLVVMFTNETLYDDLVKSGDKLDFPLKSGSWRVGHNGQEWGFTT